MADFEKKYTEKEFRRIIEKALLLQQQDRNPASSEISRSDLLSMAAELGIRENYLIAAMEDTAPHGGTALTKFLGGDYKHSLSIILDAAPETVDVYDTMNEIPELLKMQGTSNVSNDNFNWRNDSMAAYAQGIVSSVNGHITRDGKFKIEIRENYAGMAGGLFGGIIGGFGVGAGVSAGLAVGISIGSVLFATLVPLASLGGSYLLCRLLFGNYVKGRRKRLSRLADFLRGRFSGKPGER